MCAATGKIRDLEWPLDEGLPSLVAELYVHIVVSLVVHGALVYPRTDLVDLAVFEFRVEIRHRHKAGVV
jgi:hypothetical protein